MPDRLVENIIKYGLLIATSPIWWPILRTLFEELQAALWREGGLIGRPPTQHEFPQLEKRYRNRLTPFLNESFAERQTREKEEELQAREDKRNKRKRKKAADEPETSVRPAARRTAGKAAPASQRRSRGTGGGARRARTTSGGLRRVAGGAGGKGPRSGGKPGGPKRRGF
jgi:hypothetical protein